MKNILVMGGTSFAGKALVRELLRQDYHVTVATRGQAKVAFEGSVEWVQFERTDLDSMMTAFSGKAYDVVFDQIGYCADDVADACEVFAGKIGHYVFTSSIAAYTTIHTGGMVETDLDLEVSWGPGRHSTGEVGYGEGKLQAEAYLAQMAPFPFAAARIPIVLGADDPLNRLGWLVGRILDGAPIVIQPGCGVLGYIGTAEKGRFLTWLGLSGQEGAYNASSEPWLDPLEFTRLTGESLGVEPIVRTEGDDPDRMNWINQFDLTMDVSKARQAGFEFAGFDQWFPNVVKETAARYTVSKEA